MINKTVRVNSTMEQLLLEELDQACKDTEETRSRFIATAVRLRLASLNLRKVYAKEDKENE